MSHNLFGDRFLGRREPAWHALGTTFEEPITASQAIEIAGLDYDVFTAPMHADIGGFQIPVGKVAIVRAPTEDDPQFRVLGSAGTNYEVLNNCDIAAILDPLTERWPVETVGALGYGERVFFTLALGEADILGDPINEFFLVTEGKTGGESVSIAYTPIRVVCQNTLTLGLARATVRSAVVHSTGARSALRFQVDVMSRLRIARDEGFRTLTSLATKHVGTHADAIFRAGYPDPKMSAKASLAATIASSRDLDADILLQNGEGRQLLSATSLHQYMLDRAANYREACNDCYVRFADEQPQFAGTAYAAYNAVVEVADFAGIGRRGDSTTVFGNSATIKERALAAAVSL